MQTQPLLILSGWSACIRLYPSISIKISGVEESKYISDKQIKSYSWTEFYAFNWVSFEKLCAHKLLRFQWQTER